MSNLLEQTISFKRAERKSGKLPSKLRFTSATKLSLQKNIDYNFLEKAINKLNTLYSELISAVEIAEKAKAEEEARSKLAGNLELEAKIEQDEKISKMTEASIVNKRLKRVTIELLKLAGRIGTYKNNYGINVKKGFAQKPPKAISVQKLYSDVYRSLMNKIDLYKMAEKKGLEVSNDGAVVTKEEEVPEWRKLFNNIKSVPSNVTVAMNKTNDYDEEQEFVPPSSNKISEEDLAHRKLLAQIGDEFELIESYEKSPSGVPSQFKDGIESRKLKLSEIFSNETGVETKNRSVSTSVINDNTDFQNLIDKVNGYNEPLSEEEHKKMEESLNEYYSSEEVSSKINELNEKDVLFTFNQHMDDVIKAESKQNSETAVVSVVDSEVETKISEEELAKQQEKEKWRQAGEVQARMLKTLYDYMDARDKFEEQKREEERQMQKMIRESAEEEAQKLHENNVLLDSAEVEARRIIKEEQKAIDEEKLQKEILSSAKEEAKRINENNFIIDSAEVEAHNIIAEEEKAQEEEKLQKEILTSAKEEAQKLHENNVLLDSAEVEARRIIKEEQKAINEEKLQKEILSSAKEEARRINENNFIIDSAETEAKRIIEAEREQEYKELVEGANAEAARLNDINLIVDSVDNQAKELQHNNEYIDILESAEVEARIIQNKNKKAKLLQDAEKLREQLKNLDEEAVKIDETIAQFVDSDSMNNTIQIPVIKQETSKSESQLIKMEDAFFDPEIIDSAEQEAKRLYENNVLLDSAEEEAKKLYDQNIMADSIEQEARRIFDNNLIADSVEVEAKRLYEQNEIIDSAEEEARKLYEQNLKEIANEEKAKAKEEKNKTKTSKAKEINVANLEIVNNSDRYGELTNKSNALLVRKSRIENIYKRINKEDDVLNKRREALTSLKEEIESGDYSFLKRSENASEVEHFAKAA